jgi:hypothetical protein
MSGWSDRVPMVMRISRAFLLMFASGGLLFFCCCGGWILLFPVGEPASGSVHEKKTTLTHAERVVLAAELMHKAQYRADPNDSLETQLQNALLGERGLKSPHSRVTCEWILHAFQEGRCSLQLEARGRWSDKTARVVLAEFNRFSSTLCPDAALEVKSLVHYARDNAPQEIRAGGNRVRVTLYEEAHSAEGEWWQMLIELWPQN